ncbi:MAG: thioredoxin family protein [Alphaproteobacteria bacterium]|nr:thioredoxin family protein [Alphaproteobacteria bacterium]
MMRKILAGLTVCFALQGAAQAAAIVKADHVTLSALLESPAKPGTTVWAAIRQEIEPGWHTYWINPGESGLATTIAWQLPKGVNAGAAQWPSPQRFVDDGIVNYGYAREATILVPLKVAADAAVGPATARVSLLECEHMCIPEDVTLSLDLRRASASPLFAAARKALPRPQQGISRIAVNTKAVVVTVHDPALVGARPRDVQFFPTTPQVVDDTAAPRIAISGDTLVWTMPRSKFFQPVAGFQGVLEVAGAPALAVTARQVAPPAPQPPQAGGATPTLVEALLLAFLGGLILNLMPCVLPILSMKALALAKAAGDMRGARRDAMFYVAGVMASFAAMAALLLALKATGAALGWGFQLQSPPVVFGLAALMAAIGLNLLGAFELPLSLAGMGDGLTRGHGGQGAFFTGALAVLVASPCTAPFMGTALGYALTQNAPIAASVFLALGAGFAAPFAVLALSPPLVRLMPRPGTWMIRFKQALAFPMFASAIWLVWVLDQQIGATGMALALSIGLGFVFLAWLLPLLGTTWRWLIGPVALTGLLLLAARLDPAPGAASDGQWVTWSPQAVADARRDGRPVLVDFSAAWCVTCLVNERVALRDPEVAARLERDHVVTLRGDWTNRSAAITGELNHYGRSGVPLYLLYPPHHSAVVLPQILTPSAVLAALQDVETAQADQSRVALARTSIGP